MRNRNIIDLYEIMLGTLEPNELFEKDKVVGLCSLCTFMFYRNLITFDERERLLEDLKNHKPKQLYTENLWFKSRNREDRYKYVSGIINLLKAKNGKI